MSGELIVAVLSEALHHFGSITPANQREVSQWVQRRVMEIKTGQASPTVAHPSLPRSVERSWYEREPGEDDS